MRAESPIFRGRADWPGQQNRIYRLVLLSAIDSQLSTEFLRLSTTGRGPITPPDGHDRGGRGFIKEALTAMGGADRVDEIKSVPDLMEFDEGRIE